MILFSSFYFLMASIYMNFLMIKFLLMKQKFLMEWFLLSIMSNKMTYIMYFDWMTLMFMSTIFFISSMVILYSNEYMKNDLNKMRFFMLIYMFIFSMILMILSPQMLSILIGWDGLGLTSYCLINFYQNKKSYISSMNTFLMNRFGDICILMLISLMLMKNSWNLLFMKNLNFLMMMLMIMISYTKSAQIPFSAWLPMAMAAPTPVSSLVHSSTLVTAGIYLIIRFNNIMSMYFMKMMMILSCFTMIMSSMNALFEYDIKKIIALSTLSQLSLMFFSLSLKLNKLTFFHLNTHAMFKSLLFLCSGVIIHNFFNNQDIRMMGYLNMNMPIISTIMNISLLTLSGFPFLSGFYSKDLIMEMYFMMKNNNFIYLIIYLSISLTLMYSMRLMFFLNLKNNNNYMFSKFKFNLMIKSILLIMLMSIFYGSMLNWMLMNSLNFIIMNYMKLMTMMILILSMFMYMLLIKMNKFMNKYFMKMMNFMFYLPMIYTKMNKNLMKLNNLLIKNNEMSWIEFLSFKMVKTLIMNPFKKKMKMNTMYMIIIMMMLLILI